MNIHEEGGAGRQEARCKEAQPSVSIGTACKAPSKEAVGEATLQR